MVNPFSWISATASLLLCEDEASMGSRKNVPLSSKIFEAFVLLGVFCAFLAAVIRVEKCYCVGFFQECKCLEASAVVGLSDLEQQIMEVKTQVLLYLGWVAIAVFCVEFLIRLCAKGFVGYLTNGGEIWRFLCLATLLARQIFTYFVKPAVPIFDLSFLRIVEFSAVFYRYEAFRSVRVVGETLQRSLRGVVQVMMILTLIIILFGVMGMNFYGGQYSRFRVRCAFDRGELDQMPDAWKASHISWSDIRYPSGKPYYCPVTNGSTSGCLNSVSGPNYAPGLGNFTVKPVFPIRLCSFDPLNMEMYKGKVSELNTGPYPEDKFGWSRPEPAGGYECKSYESCQWVGGNMFTDINFDQFYNTVLLLMTGLFREGWQPQFQSERDTWVNGIANFYFTVLIIFGSFYVLNLTVAITAKNYMLVCDDEDKIVQPDEENDENTQELTTAQIKRRERAVVAGDFAFYDYDSGKIPFIKNLVTFPKLELEDSHRFSHFDVICLFPIGFNILLLCARDENLPFDTVYSKLCLFTSLALHVIFCLELVLRILGQGVVYLTHPLNALDALVTVYGMVCTYMAWSAKGGYVETYFRFRGITLLRCLRGLPLRCHMPLYNKLSSKFRIIFNDTLVLVSACSLTMSYVLVSAVFVKELIKFKHLRNNPNPDGEPTQLGKDFEDITGALYGLIEVLFSANFSEYVAEIGGELKQIGVAFMIVYFILGQYLFQRVFVAIILRNMAIPEDKRIDLQVKFLEDWREEEAEAAMRKAARSFKSSSKVEPPTDYISMESFFDKVLGSGTRQVPVAGDANNEPANFMEGEDEDDDTSKKIIVMELSTMQKLHGQLEAAAESSQFDYLMLLIVITSSFFDVVPLSNPQSQKDMDRLFLGIYLCEFCFKIVALGAFVGRKAYFLDGWNLADFFILSTMVAEEFLPHIPEVGAFRSVRLVRILRRVQAFGTMKTNQFKMLMTGATGALPEIALILIILMIFMFCFAIIGMDLFGKFFFFCTDDGSLYYKNEHGMTWESIFDKDYNASILESKGLVHDPPAVYLYQTDEIGKAQFESAAKTGNIPTATWGFATCRGQYFDRQFSADKLEYPVGMGVYKPRVWDSPMLNFITFRQAFASLFMVLNKSGLSNVMSFSTAIRGFNIQPERRSSVLMSVYYILFMLFGSVFLSQVVIGSVISTLKQKSGNAFWSLKQRGWQATRKVLKTLPYPKYNPPLPPEQPVRRLLYNLAKPDKKYGKFFEVFMLGIIMFNSIVMCMPHYDQPESFSNTIKIFNRVFLAVYIFEAFVKILGLGPAGFFKPVGWSIVNIADFLIVVIAIVEEILPLIGVQFAGGFAVFRVMRVTRVFRMFRGQKELQALLTAMVGSLLSVLCAVVLLLLFVYIWASMGVKFFLNAPDDLAAVVGNTLAEDLNFKNIMNAIMLLFSLTCGTPYGPIQNRLGVSGPECTTDSKNYPHEVACGPAYTNVYFVIFVLGSNYLLLPLFIATLVEHFTTSADSDLAYVSMDDMEVYKATWILFEEIEDGNRDGFIPIWKLRPLIEELASRSCKLGFNIGSEQMKWEAVQEDIAALKCPKDNEVPFYNTCIILVVRSIEMEELTAIDYQDRNNVKAKLVHMAHCQPIGSGVLSEERQKLQDASHGGHTNSHDAWV